MTLEGTKAAGHGVPLPDGQDPRDIAVATTPRSSTSRPDLRRRPALAATQLLRQFNPNLSERKRPPDGPPTLYAGDSRAKRARSGGRCTSAPSGAAAPSRAPRLQPARGPRRAGAAAHAGCSARASRGAAAALHLARGVPDEPYQLGHPVVRRRLPAPAHRRHGLPGAPVRPARAPRHHRARRDTVSGAGGGSVPRRAGAAGRQRVDARHVQPTAGHRGPAAGVRVLLGRRR